jgi:hypothetical protein
LKFGALLALAFHSLNVFSQFLFLFFVSRSFHAVNLTVASPHLHASARNFT